MSYNVFVDHPVTGRNVEIFSTDRAYDASALANIFSDAGFKVSTDLWDTTVWDAMVSPVTWEQFNLDRFPQLLSV